MKSNINTTHKTMQIKHKITCDKDRINFMRLARTNGVGSVTFSTLVNGVENFSNIIEFSEEFFKKRSGRKITITPKDEVEKEIENTEKLGAKIILITDDNYPFLLKNIADPPPVIVAKGDKSLLNRDIIGIVGSRNASFHGLDFASNLAEELSWAGVVIASGMARGIDSVAHSAALDCGTIGVIAGGIDNIYPLQNKELFERVVNEGLLISEFSCGTLPKAKNFIQRNRIISGLSYGVVVVEATNRSGSLVTARFALEQGREVYAVPGFPSDERSAGCNGLIEQGATSLTSAKKIIEEIPKMREIFREVTDPVTKIKKPKVTDFNEEESSTQDEFCDVANQIYKKLGLVEISIEEIYEIFANKVQDVNIALSGLELEDKIEIRGDRVVKLS